MPADIVDLDDTGVIDARGGARLSEEPLDELALRAVRRQQHLDRGAPAEPFVETDVHDAEPATPERAFDAIRADLLVHLRGER